VSTKEMERPVSFENHGFRGKHGLRSPNKGLSPLPCLIRAAEKAEAPRIFVVPGRLYTREGAARDSVVRNGALDAQTVRPKGRAAGDRSPRGLRSRVEESEAVPFEVPSAAAATGSERSQAP
jgi:hypothetical protein